MQLATRPQHVSFPFPHCHHSPLAAQLRPLACPTRHAHWSLGFSSGQQANELPLLNSRRSSSGSSSRNHSRTRAHRTAVTLQQHQQHQQHRPPSPPGQHHGQHHRHQLRDDGSLKIIMLLSLSLTLLLLPWVAHHPEFLIAPFVLAVTPVVGNGVRPVLKEVAAGFISALRLMGMAAWFDITHELPPAHQQHGSSHNHGSMQQQQQRNAAMYQQQQAQQYNNSLQQQQQQQQPSGPHSPWPNPAYMPANWPPAAAAPAAAARSGSSSPGASSSSNSQVANASANNIMSHPLAAAAAGGDASDVDWAPSSPPDPHRVDPASLQHLQLVLDADMLTEAELGGNQQHNMGGQHTASSSSRRRSPAGSPSGSPALGNSPSASVASLDGGDFALPPQQQQQQQQQGANKQQQQQSRDPRVLSKKAKQQLYQNHNHNHHMHPHPGSASSSGGSNGGGQAS